MKRPPTHADREAHRKLSRFHRAGSAVERILRDGEELRYDLRMELRLLDEVENPSALTERKIDAFGWLLRQLEKALPTLYAFVPVGEHTDWAIPLPKVRRWQVLPEERWTVARHKREMRRKAGLLPDPNVDVVNEPPNTDEILKRIGYGDSMPGRWKGFHGEDRDGEDD